jgi:AcrR family transcriptional regulator
MQEVSVISVTGPQPSVAESRAPAAEPHRRERKKRQTREALVHAALKLFDTKGYEHTAVREITDAVDVSERTFFRYFASKEELALSFARDASDSLIRELAARPPAEEPLVALRNAFRGSQHSLTGTVAADEGHPAEESVYLLVVKLIESTPSLLAAYLRYIHDREDVLVRVLAEREGVDPATDLRPRIAALVFGGLVATANREWRAEGGGSVEEMLAAFDACLEQVGPALAGHWTAR